MKTLVLIGIVVLVAGIVLRVVLVRLRAGADGAPWPFYAKKVLSSPEQVLYHRLVYALPECIVLAQVQLSRVLGVKKGFNFAQWNNRINRLSLDFVVCLKDSSVVAAVELDDASHQGPRREEADRRKTRAVEAAGITLIRWSTKAMPDEATIRATFTDSKAPGAVLAQASK